MPLDPALLQETKEWLLRAEEDLKAAEHLCRISPPLLSSAAFHAQQSAEKVEKAFLTWNQKPFSKTHDLRALGADCVALDTTLTTICKSAAAITGYAIEPRYPGPWRQPTLAETTEAIRLATELFAEILIRLPNAAHPT